MREDKPKFTEEEERLFQAQLERLKTTSSFTVLAKDSKSVWEEVSHIGGQGKVDAKVVKDLEGIISDMLALVEMLEDDIPTFYSKTLRTMETRLQNIKEQ